MELRLFFLLNSASVDTYGVSASGHLFGVSRIVECHFTSSVSVKPVAGITP